ncbi:MAG: carbohydrate-binding domain-containing protein [Bacteroidales bacterium]|nr:carbohydrate-binding domain-containing protein [Bacteroidales bacterium]
MKKMIIAVLAGAMTFFSCEKDIIDIGTSGTAAGDSAGEDIVVDSSDDLIANTSFDRTVTVTYSSSGASVSGADGLTVSTSGAGVTITNSGTEVVKYILSGSSSNGYFKLYSSKKQAIVLSSLSLTNPSGAPINNQSHKRTFVVLEGSNTLTDGTYTESSEDEKAALFSEGQLVFSGSGTLTVKATGKSGITSDDYVRVLDGPTLKVNSTAGHGIRGKEAVIVSGGTINVEVSGTGKKGVCSDTLVYIGGGVTTITSTSSAGTVDGELTGAAGIKADLRFEMEDGKLTVNCSGSGCKGITGDNVAYFKGGNVLVRVTGSNYGSSSSSSGMGGRPGGFGGFGGGSSSSSSNSKSAKAVKFDGNIYISGGVLNARASSHEAIEAKGTITISGGEVYAESSDDAINSAGNFTISGGTVCAYSTGNDGLDANGNFYIKGGTVYAIGSGGAENAIDANTEGGYKLYVSGGTIVTVGGLENGSSLTQTCYSASSWSKNTWYEMTVGSSSFVFKTPQSGGSGMVVSGSSKPSLTSGVTVSGGSEILNGMAKTGASVSGGSAVTLSSYSSSSGMGGRW